MISVSSLLLQRGEAMPSQNATKISSSIEDSNSSSGASTPRSSSIPLPRSHILRTESEVQLSHAEAAAEQRDLHMFYRLVNGIRSRQAESQRQETSIPHHHQSQPLPSRILDGYPQAPQPANDVFGWQEGPRPSLSLYLQSQGLPVEPVDSWSITGFDCASNNDMFAPNISSGFSPQQQEEDEVLDEDEGIFTLDL